MATAVENGMVFELCEGVDEFLDVKDRVGELEPVLCALSKTCCVYARDRYHTRFEYRCYFVLFVTIRNEKRIIFRHPYPIYPQKLKEHTRKRKKKKN